MADHAVVERCRHGRVVSQCRCLGPKREVRVACPPGCLLDVEPARPLVAPGRARAEGEAALAEVRALQVKLQERTLRLVQMEADRHSAGNPRHSVSKIYPHYCACGWRGSRYPASELPRDPYGQR